MKQFLLFFQAAAVVTLQQKTTAFAPARTQADSHRHAIPISTIQVQSTTESTDTSVDDVVSSSSNNPRQSGLALQLDEGTRKAHSMAENTAFVTGFFKGISKPESYRNLLTSLYYVYDAMETTLQATHDEGVQLLDDAALRRVPSLEQDMQYFYGSKNDDWKTQLPKPTAATVKYVARIEELGNIKNNPELSYLLIAHQYTRYLGDLFGGQMMGGMAVKSMKLPQDGSGVAFYTFDDIDNNQKYITDWYRRLNSIDLTQEQKEKIVEEANLVFALNIGILEELDGSPLAALWTMGISTLKEKLGLS